MLREAKDLFSTEPNVITSVGDSVTIVGPLHGSIWDALKIINTNPKPPIHKYVFLGNYINRGAFNVETMIFLIAFKLNFSKEVILLWGPHETKKMCEYFNFKSECLSKYSDLIYDLFIEVFERLPIACVINSEYFCVSGGISPDCETIDKLSSI